jgi:hypothetical protein
MESHRLECNVAGLILFDDLARSYHIIDHERWSREGAPGA